MNIHKNACLTPIGRERLVLAVLSGQTPKAVRGLRIVRRDRADCIV